MTGTFWTLSLSIVFLLGAGCMWCLERAVEAAKKDRREYHTDLIRELTRRKWSLVSYCDLWLIEDELEPERNLGSGSRHWQVAIQDALHRERLEKEKRF